MRVARKLAMSLAAVSAILSAPAAAQVQSDAEKIRRLDMMLMATSLRCRLSADNFQADYAGFVARQRPSLTKANADLRRQFSRSGDVHAAERALDRISTDMANQYGTGHPWLSCAELKQATRTLAAMQGEAPLLEAADQLLGTVRPRRLAGVTP